jgi:hypothetical protein
MDTELLKQFYKEMLKIRLTSLFPSPLGRGRSEARVRDKLFI